MKALLHFRASHRLRERLAPITEPAIAIVDPQDEAGFARERMDAEVLLHVLTPVTAAMIAAMPRLRLIQKIGVGVNTIDRAAAAGAGVEVANMPGTNTVAVAEHTLALMLAVLRRIASLDTAMRLGEGWAVTADAAEALGELNGARIGFLGYGAVPQRLAPALLALGADSLFWNRSARPDAAARQVGFDDLLASADILSLHLPLAPETQHILDVPAIARMKHGAIVVNTARGKLIDQGALARALRQGRLAGAGLDVFEDEPYIDTGELTSIPTVVMSPHIAWLTPQTLERSLGVIVENCRRLAAGKPLLHRAAQNP